jgi:tetratricopeptide (TPR) repeat protein
MATSPRDRLLQFSRHYAAGEFDSALELIDALLAEHPDAGPMHWQRARTLEKLRRWDETRAAVDKVIELRHEFAPAWVMRAELAAAADDPDDPELDLRKAIVLDPRLGRPRYLLALLLHGRGDRYDEARALMDEAIALDPQLHEALAARAGWSRIEAYTDQPQGDAAGPDVILAASGIKLKRVHLEDALADFERAIAVEPHPDYRFARSDLLQQLHRVDEAIAELERLLDEIPAGHDLYGLAEEAWRVAVSRRLTAGVS